LKGEKIINHCGWRGGTQKAWKGMQAASKGKDLPKVTAAKGNGDLSPRKWIWPTTWMNGSRIRVRASRQVHPTADFNLVISWAETSDDLHCI
jgi:hypothetical protein